MLVPLTPLGPWTQGWGPEVSTPNVTPVDSDACPGLITLFSILDTQPLALFLELLLGMLPFPFVCPQRGGHESICKVSIMSQLLKSFNYVTSFNLHNTYEICISSSLRTEKLRVREFRKFP